MVGRRHRLGFVVLAFLLVLPFPTKTLSGQDYPEPGEDIPVRGLHRDKKSGMLYGNGKKLGRYSTEEAARFRPHPCHKFLTYSDGKKVLLFFEGTDSWQSLSLVSFSPRAGFDESFEALNPFVARDKTTTYYIGREPCGPLPDARFLMLSFFPLEGNPPPGSLVILPDTRYMKSPGRVYYLGRPVEGADPSTFTTFSQTFPSISEVRYNETMQDFEKIEACAGIAADGRRVFLGDAIVPRLAPGAGFRPISRCLVIAGGAVYHTTRGEFTKLDAADARSLRMIGRRFAADRDTVFHLTRALPGADPETFVEIDDVYGRDAHRVFAYNSPVTDADPQTLRSLGRGYACDAKRAYLHGAPIPEADPAKFTLYTIAEKYKAVLRAAYRVPEEKFLFAQDGQRVFHGSVVVPHADPRAFQPEPYLIDLFKAEKERIDRLYREGKIRF